MLCSGSARQKNSREIFDLRRQRKPFSTSGSFVSFARLGEERFFVKLILTAKAPLSFTSCGGRSAADCNQIRL